MRTPVLLIPIPQWVRLAVSRPEREGGRQAHTTHQPRSHLAFPNRKADVISRTKSPGPVNGGPSRMPFSRQLP